jgi:hypothetical protein
MKPGDPLNGKPGRSGIFMPLISYHASVGINKKTKTQTTNTKITLKNRTINVRHHDDCHHSSEDESCDDRASSPASDGKESANKSSNYWSAGNYHLVVLSKKEDG